MYSVFVPDTWNPGVRWPHLVLAINEATGQFGAGLREVVAPSWRPMVGQAAFQDVAGGTEKLAKITDGVWFAEEHGRYPTDAEARKDGHDVQALATRVQRGIAARARAERNSYIVNLCQSLDDDPNWLPLLEVLNTAADAGTGRYRHTAILGGKDLSDHESAYELWEVVESDVITDLGMWSHIRGAGLQPDASITVVRERILFSLLRWWRLVHRAWQHGLVGIEARRFSSEIGLEFDRLPSNLRVFVKAL